jgi:hypothetical protein
MPQEAQDKLEELRRLYGKDPEDAEWGYLKGGCGGEGAHIHSNL